MELSIYKNKFNEYCVLKNADSLLTYNSSFKSKKEAQQFIKDYNKKVYPDYETKPIELENAITRLKFSNVSFNR